MAWHSLLAFLVSVSAKKKVLDLALLFLAWSSHMACYGKPHPAAGHWVIIVDYSKVIYSKKHPLVSKNQ